MNKLIIFFIFFAIKIYAFHEFEQKFGARTTDSDECILRNINQCYQMNFTAKGFQCCKCKINGSPICNPMVKIKSALDEMATKNGEILTKEYIGFSIFSDNKEYISYEFECPDGKFNFTYTKKNYTDDDQKKFKSAKHCMKYFNLKSGSISKENCYQADLATTGNSKVSCGYYEFDITMTDGSKTNYQTCFLFNEDIRNTLNFGYLVKQMAEDVAVSKAIDNGKELSSYKMTGTNSGGSSYVYDSFTDKLSSSKFLNCRILLLILFYIFIC